MDWSEGDLVWFDPGLGHPIPGEIQEIHQAAQIIIVQALIKGQPQSFTLAPGEGNLLARQDLGNSGVEDLTQLEDLHEASLLWNLRLRYDKGLIYTFAGSILIAVNPYKMFPDAYGLEIAKKYSGKSLGVLPPHLFAIGSAAHAALPSPQVVVISGESGSGKTESTKLVMQYLAAVVQNVGSASTVITEQILEVAPLLEAFGNARTTRNDNSSRFGKYLEVYFKSGGIVGAKITQYLLEKSRIVTQALGERNYHVFYEMLGGLQEAERIKYGLLEANKYFYLNQGGSDCAPGRIDWESLQSAMQVLGVSEIERESIVRVLASVLHLGNVYFHRRQLRHGQEGVEIGSDAEIKWAAHLLHISGDGLHRSLTTRVTETRSERLQTPLSIDQALDARDAFAKVLYAGLFNWLVSRINSIVHKGGTHDAHRISILDIFGFEDLAENSFEQLCINYANENLQLYFNKHVFKLEQSEYTRERLEWTPLIWDDNIPVIHLLAKKPVGIFHLLDDESNFPRATDISFLEKCHYNHALNELYSRPRIGAHEFGITHYAGHVRYCVEGFLDKNRDALRQDVLDLLDSSKLQLILDLTKHLRAQHDAGKSLPKGSNGRFVTMKPRTPTVGARFSDSLQQLLQSMAKCNPWFVRCVKPNNEKHSLKMDMPCVLQQLRYLGMLDTIKIRQKGYPVRLRFQHFVERYRHLMKSIPRGTPYKELCRNVLESLNKSEVEGPDFQLGTTRVFLRESLHRHLEAQRSDRLKNAALIIQRNVRGMLSRKKLLRQKKAIIIIQSTWRGYNQNKKFKKLKSLTVRVQAVWRGKIQRRRYKKLKLEMQRRKEFIQAQKERQSQKIAKENAEKNQIVHLDIPAELAFIFSKLEGWTPVHGDRHLVKVVGTVPGPPTANDLPPDLDQFAFGKFSSVYCNGIKLSQRREPITAPFLSRAASKDQDYQDSLAVFKLILRWANDNVLDSGKEKALIDYIVYKGLSSRCLRDEILIQLCNQTSHSDEKQSQRIWQLMAHCLSCFQPGPAFSKYLMKYIKDNAPNPMKELLLKKLLRNSGNFHPPLSRLYPPSWLEFRVTSKLSDMAVVLTLPNDITQTVAIDSWTTCEEAASFAISTLGIPNQGWSITLDDAGLISDSCGIDFVLDLISEKELYPAFPMTRNDLLKSGRKKSKNILQDMDSASPKRPKVPPPEPPLSKISTKIEPPIPEPLLEKKVEYQKHFDCTSRKTSHELLSRNSALNERYFETEKTRSRSLDDLLSAENLNVPATPEPESLTNLGLSESRLNERYHSTERLIPLNKESTPRYQKSQYAGRRPASSHSSKYVDKTEYATRSSAMSDTSEAPSLASHVRRVRVPSQASDVDQFLDDLFSPVLDGSLDELSDARSLAASIRGGLGEDCSDIQFLDQSLSNLTRSQILSSMNKEGDLKSDGITVNQTIENVHVTEFFNPILISNSVRNLSERNKLLESIKGGETTHQKNNTTNGFVVSPLSPNTTNSLASQDAMVQMVNAPQGSDPTNYQQQIQRAFLQSAMAQNLQIQQQLLAQNQALQTLLSQQENTTTSPTSLQSNQIHVQTTAAARKQSFQSNLMPLLESDRNRKISSESTNSLIPPPPPPPMPPPIEYKDPSETRPFLDPYGRAKTVRIGKWRWPPPQDGLQNDTDENFLHFKMRQNQRKNTPQTQNFSNNSSPNDSTTEWDEFDIETTQLQNQIQQIKEHYPKQKVQESSKNLQFLPSHQIVVKSSKRSFEIGADRPPPGSIGKLKLSSEMRQRLEQVTAGHSVRSSVSTRSEQRAPAKLEDARKMMLQQQLTGHLISNNADNPEGAELTSVRTQIQRMESSKRPPPPPWPSVLPPAPSSPAPPPPVRPPNTIPPAPPSIPSSPPPQYTISERQNHFDIPAFIQRQERDTFGAHHIWNDSEIPKEIYNSYVLEETVKLERIYEPDFKKENLAERERSRSRSRSRDRENFSESVWDRNEVEGPPSNGSDREREKRESYEIRQFERERESNKYYQPTIAVKSNIMNEKEINNKGIKNSVSATFKTHMVQKYAKEREKKIINSTLIEENTDKLDGIDAVNNWPTPVIPAPVPAPPSLKAQSNACLTYNRVNWKLRVRKEVFRPNEPIGHPIFLDMLYAQIISDIFEITECIRITPQDKRSACNMLNGHGINFENMWSSVRAIVKRQLIEMARSWPLYFARLFPVNGAPQFPNISLLAVSHKGVYLTKREADCLTVILSIPYTELQSVITLPKPGAFQLNMRNGNRIVLHAARASYIQNMVQSFFKEAQEVQTKASTISSGARAAAQTLNVPIERLEVSRDVHNHSISPMVEKHSNQRNENAINNHQNHQGLNSQISQHYQQAFNKIDGENESNAVNAFTNHPRKNSVNNLEELGVQSHSEDDFCVDISPSKAKYSLLQFAIQHFRKDDINNEYPGHNETVNRGEKQSTTYRPHLDLVKWQGKPIRVPLLRLPPDLVQLALECFDCILRYCGDLPLDPDLTEVKCVYTVLMHCHKYLALRDEVYCQLMKQTTVNRSPCPDSGQRAWRLLSILAAYFGCSDALRPYLMEHLTTAASDRHRSCHGTAAVCLTNLRKTARCGGRKNVPSVEEVTAVSAGRSARRQIYRLPGGAERVVNTKCSTVVTDVISELCSLLAIESQAEQQEFSLYCIVQGDAFTMPLAADEYILDVTTELLKSGQPFYLIFCRSVWYFPLKRDPIPTPLYTEVLFNQVAPDYLEGLLLELPITTSLNPDTIHDMVQIAALLHRAADLNHVPTMKEIKFLLPKPALGVRELRPAQWVALVQAAWPSVINLSPGEVKAQFLNVLSLWPLFGSSFFAVKRIWTEDGSPVDESNSVWKDLILALNRRGVLFLDSISHETLQHWPFMEVISTRKVRSEDGALFLDMKVGNLMQQRVIRVQTEQAHEISRLVRQYITMAQLVLRDKAD